MFELLPISQIVSNLLPLATIYIWREKNSNRFSNDTCSISMESFLFFSQNLSSDRKDFVLDGKEGASGRISSGLKVARSTIPDSVRVRVCVCTRACNVTIHLCIHYGPMGERIRREKGVKKRNVPFQGTRPQFPCTRPEIRPRHISARPATRNQRRDSIRRILG